jgi:hypothetical protein
LQEKKISPGDLDLLVITDDPREAAETVIQAYETENRSSAKRAKLASGQVF